MLLQAVTNYGQNDVKGSGGKGLVLVRRRGRNICDE